MSKVSIVIPARNELYLQQTVDEIFNKATGDIEVIVVLDGYWPDPPLKDNLRQVIIHREKKGMRTSINNAVNVAKGKYIMKVDAHCLFATGFDETMKADCDGDWVVNPRRYSVEPDSWTVRFARPFVDYEYLGFPYGRKFIHGSKIGLHAWVWDERIETHAHKLLDENMTFQGSCWFCEKEHFVKRIGYLSDVGYGTFIGEAQEIGLKTWLSGGKCMLNKKTWYGHLWKGQPYRDAYKLQFGTSYTRLGHTEAVEGNKYSVDYWINNKWEGRIHDLSWLIDRFWPVPSWEEERKKWKP